MDRTILEGDGERWIRPPEADRYSNNLWRGRTYHKESADEMSGGHGEVS